MLMTFAISQMPDMSRSLTATTITTTLLLLATKREPREAVYHTGDPLLARRHLRWRAGVAGWDIHTRILREEVSWSQKPVALKSA